MTYLQSGLLMAPTDGSSPVVALVIQFGLIFLIFYWLLIRPQQKERQRHQALISGLKKGDEVVTAGGIIGTVVHVESDRITIRSAESTRLIVERGKVAGIVAGSSAGASSATS